MFLCVKLFHSNPVFVAGLAWALLVTLALLSQNPAPGIPNVSLSELQGSVTAHTLQLLKIPNQRRPRAEVRAQVKLCYSLRTTLRHLWQFPKSLLMCQECAEVSPFVLCSASAKQKLWPGLLDSNGSCYFEDCVPKLLAMHLPLWRNKTLFKKQKSKKEILLSSRLFSKPLHAKSHKQGVAMEAFS